MAVRRALVDCAVLAVQHGSVVYPCCRDCFSRIDVQRDTTRCKCSKCGYSCGKDQVDYRYRLSLRVARGSSIFGVTVFGTCLNPFFGINASGLQRLIECSEEPEEATTRSALLMQAVEDCFIGRHFLFEIKINKSGSSPLIGATGVTSRDPIQFIASQILLPQAAVGGGCSVLCYYRLLLERVRQRNQTCPPGSPPPGFRLAAPLLIHHRSPVGGVTCTTPSRLLSRPLQRLMHFDSILSPASPWQQSLGVVTSSAEQDEGCSTHRVGDEHNGRSSDRYHPPHQTPAAPSTLGRDDNVTETMALHPLPSAYESCFGDCRFAPVLSTSSDPLPPAHCPLPLSPTIKRSPRLSPDHGEEWFDVADLPAWEDMPFSEGLEEFIHKENRSERRTISPVTSPGHLKANDLPNTFSSLGRLNARSSAGRSSRKILLDVGNAAVLSQAGEAMLSQVDEGMCSAASVACERCSPNGRKLEKAEASRVDNERPPCDETSDGEDPYNCSADLFGDLPIIMTTQMADTSTEAGGNGQTHQDIQTDTDTETQPVSYLLRTGPDTQHPRSAGSAAVQSCPQSNASVAQSINMAASNNQPSDVDHTGRSRQSHTQNRDLFHSGLSGMLDFIPSSHSTPLAKAAVYAGCRSKTPRQFNLYPEQQQPRARIHHVAALRESGGNTASLMNTSNSFTAVPPHRESRRHRLVVSGETPSRPSCKLSLRMMIRRWDEAAHSLAGRQRPKLRRKRPSDLDSVTDACVMSTCGDEGEAMACPSTSERVFPVSGGWREQTAGCVSPTPAKTSLAVAQDNGVDWRSSGAPSAGEVMLDETSNHFPLDKDEPFNWSRDLFADSFH